MTRTVKLVKRPITVNNRMKQIREEVETQIHINLLKHQELRDKATKGWSDRNKPKFPKFVKYAKSPNRRMEFGVIVDAKNEARGSTSGHSVYRMNNDDRGSGLATKVRWAFMGSGYMSKTKPYQFGLFGTGGEPLKFVGGKGLPGIKARLWDETANEILSPNQLQSKMSRRIIKGYRKGFRKVQGKTRNAR